MPTRQKVSCHSRHGLPIFIECNGSLKGRGKRTGMMSPYYQIVHSMIVRIANINRQPPHQVVLRIAANAIRLRHASDDDHRYRSDAWAAFAICLGAEHKHSSGRLVGICVSVARLLDLPLWPVWDGLRPDHDRSCQRDIVYLVRLNVDGRPCVWRALGATACACRWSRALAARQPDAVPHRLAERPRSARLRYHHGLYLAYRIRILARSRR